jgi:flagellar biogenesis protein FliO
MPRWILLLSLIILTQVGTATEPAAAPLFSDAEWNRHNSAVTTSASATSAQVGSEVPVGPSIASLLGGLVLVVGLAVGLGWTAKRLGMKRLIQGQGKHLTVIETVPIGFKRQATLLRLGDQVLVVGLGEHECCHLGTFAAAALGLPNTTPAQPSPLPAKPDGAFAGILAKLNSGGAP